MLRGTPAYPFPGTTVHVYQGAQVNIGDPIYTTGGNGGAAQELTAAIIAMRRSRPSASGRALHETGVLPDATTVQSRWG
jgi:hypothetical protein